MPLFDWPQDRLESYHPELPEPSDLADFWAKTLSAARSHALDVRLAPQPLHLPLVETLDLTFAGFGGQRVHAWYLRPRRTDSPVPMVVQYLGYGDGRGTPLEWLTWPAALLLTIIFAALSNAVALLMRQQEALIGISQFTALPLTFLSSAVMDLDLAPQWIQVVARYNPLDWTVTVSRQTLTGAADWSVVWPRLAALVATAWVMGWLATRAFGAYQRST